VCTLSWVFAQDSYQVFFNRDERLGRGPEVPPQAASQADVRVLRPTDSDAGGTWIAVNEYGLGVCVLNGYQSADKGAHGKRSRGLLVQDLSGARSLQAADALLQQLDFTQYKSFVVAVFAPAEAVSLWEWDGRASRHTADADERVPVCSSGHDQPGAQARRADAFRALVAEVGRSPAALDQFHRSHLDGPSAYSPCMHRVDAQTRSLTWIGVDATRVAMRHTPGPPCTTEPATEVTLPRRSGA